MASSPAPSARNRRAGRAVLWSVSTLLGLCLALCGAGTWFRHLGRLDEGRLLSERASTLYTDRVGFPLRVELGVDDQWQIPVPLTRMSPWLVQGVVAEEDKRFWRHRGVDWLAAARAAGSNLGAQRIVSGASTLTMQLARLACPQRRGWRAKAMQVLRALDLESRHPKEWILEQYLNQAPFGGNLVGVEAAARAYFGRSAGDLSLAEAALLIGLPQRPSAYRPDRRPELACERRHCVLDQLVAGGVISAARAQETSTLPLGVIRWQTGEPRPGLPRHEPLFCAAVAEACARRGETVVTTLDRQWQDIALTALKSHVARLPEVGDGAAVIIENANGAVRAMVGTLDPQAPGNGWVDATRRPRSPGSALKPFIAAAAIDAGLALPETRLCDEPLTYDGYRPENYDGQYRGEVTLREALSRSLNTPLIRLLQAVGPETAHALMLRCGLRSLARRPAAELDLSLALGSGEVTLLDLTSAYAALARGGLSISPRFSETESLPSGTQAFSPGAATLVLDMLAARPLPGAPDFPLAWKTGTSSGHRDAWCLGVNRDVTIGVWLGNKSGRPAASLVGIAAAAPVVADILRQLYARAQPPPLPAPAGLESVQLCSLSGLPAGFACERVEAGLRVEGIPGRMCPSCARQTGQPAVAAAAVRPIPADPPRILLPRPGDYLAEGQGVQLTFSAARKETLFWYIDGQFMGQFAERHGVALSRGTHSVQGIRPGTSSADRITVRVD